MRDIQELFKELKHNKLHSIDFVTPPDNINITYDAGHQKYDMSFDAVPDTNDIKNEYFPVKKHPLNQITTTCNIPHKFSKYLQESFPTLLATNINEILPQQSNRLIRILQGMNDHVPKVNAVLSDTYQIVPNYDFGLMALNKIADLNNQGHRIQVHRADLTDTHLHIKFTTDGLTDTIYGRHNEPQKGDVVNGGLIISNSDVGAGRIRVSPFVNILMCNNGMISPREFSRIHRGRRMEPGIIMSDQTKQLEDQVLWSQLNDAIESAVNPEIFHQWIDEINGVARHVIEKPMKAVQNLVESGQIPKRLEEDLLSQFSKEGHTQWGLSNAVTRIAQDEEDYNNQLDLEKLGSELLTKRMVTTYV